LSFASADNLLDLVEKIIQLKRERDAVILAHNYQSHEIQFVADYVGDTLSLAMLAKNVKQHIIVFCGPDFMVETAKILAPHKTVLYANENAKCPMAAMITREELKTMKEIHPDAKVVGYLNTSAECKCEMDVCCTSSNAVKIVTSLNTKKVIFVPDQNLASYVKRFVPDKEIIAWPGFCTVHQMIQRSDILKLTKAHPHAKILIHPECTPDVVDLAHVVLSTDGMLKYVANSLEKEFIVGTELELINRMMEDNPGKKFYPVEKAFCRTQKKIKLENILNALEILEPRVSFSEDVIERARHPVEKMLAFGRGD